MATTVEVPKLGNTVEDCLITAWRKHKGGTVVAGEIMTDALRMSFARRRWARGRHLTSRSAQPKHGLGPLHPGRGKWRRVLAPGRPLWQRQRDCETHHEGLSQRDRAPPGRAQLRRGLAHHRRSRGSLSYLGLSNWRAAAACLGGQN